MVPTFFLSIPTNNGWREGQQHKKGGFWPHINHGPKRVPVVDIMCNQPVALRSYQVKGNSSSPKGGKLDLAHPTLLSRIPLLAHHHRHMAMGQKPVPPVNIPIPTKIGSKMGGEFTYQNGTILPPLPPPPLDAGGAA